MAITPGDRTILRDLARQVAEIAHLPIMETRRSLWKRHNRLERVRPMILVFPEGSWGELLPDSALACGDAEARGIEWDLRSRIFYHQHLDDDTVIEDSYVVRKAISETGWGLEAKTIDSPQARGAWAFDPVIHGPADVEKITAPEVHYDVVETARRFEQAQDLFGDILRVRLVGVRHVSFHLMAIYSRWRGLGQVMEDMCENPEMLHDAMGRLEAGYRGIIQQYQDLNLLELNNDDAYHSSGGVGYTDELPQADFDPAHVRPCDMWASAEAQELAQVGPEMHEEFSLRYERPLLEPFGLNGYGCCEDLAQKFDYVFRIPNLRRISISPFSNVDVCAEKLEDKYIFSWKPHPSHLVGPFDADYIRRYIAHALDVTRGCVIEMILKDTHTCEHHPERFTAWTKIARDLVERYA
ncbi:MAG TPA: hypothetical protein PLO37_25845 [Candidatus Hydrogenedentes bacterium]|nr:hypothetical protein [Candidatus Hydrogenedentota bacterium]HPG70280.1 hypothetical protein [Candidatus Hydrogenedentota bacterium]